MAAAASAFVPPRSRRASSLVIGREVSTLTKRRASALSARGLLISRVSTLKQRLQMALDAGFGVAELARAAGVSNSAVSQWKSGNSKAIKGDSAVGLERVTKWRAAWWINGKGPRDVQTQPEKIDEASLDEKRQKLLAAFDELSPEGRDALLDLAMERAAEVLGKRMLAEKFKVKGYASDGKVAETIEPAPSRAKTNG